MTGARLLVLGGGNGWHGERLRRAADRFGCDIAFAGYESLHASIGKAPCLAGEAGPLGGFDALLTRTMPAGTLEQITFRLAVLHECEATRNGGGRRPAIVNTPRGLELAIDKFATLARARALGFDVPETRVVQSRGEAIDAFRELGGDCVVKPIFGGEGRGVMRVRDEQLAWTTFSTLQQLGAVHYVQSFVPPGGRDVRVLVIGDEMYGVRRKNDGDFRTNHSGGGTAEKLHGHTELTESARRLVAHLGLKFAAVDFLQRDDGEPHIIEVNAVPGWRGAQAVLDADIAERIVHLLLEESRR
jgi:RimK family alpha-L-glutamate ligase